MAVVDCCRYASEPMLVPVPRAPAVEAALAAAYEILNEVAAALEGVASEIRGATHCDLPSDERAT